MRNELTIRDSEIPFCALGELDDCDAGVMAFGGGSIVIGLGLGSISLSRAAASELAKHLVAALEVQGVRHAS